MTAETDARIARLLHHRKAGLALGEPVVPPISVATTFHLPQAQGAAHYYGRSGQPTTSRSMPESTGAVSSSSTTTETAGDRPSIRRSPRPRGAGSTNARRR